MVPVRELPYGPAAQETAPRGRTDGSIRLRVKPLKIPLASLGASTDGKLRTALLGLSGGHGKVERHAERSWASITFAGTRHTIDLSFESDEAIGAAERLIADLPDHEFTIPGQLVADAVIVSVDHTMVPVPKLEVTVELLMLEEG